MRNSPYSRDDLDDVIERIVESLVDMIELELGDLKTDAPNWADHQEVRRGVLNGLGERIRTLKREMAEREVE